MPLPIGNLTLYDHATEIYLALLDVGIPPQVALEITNLKIAEKGWNGYVTGDNKKFPSAPKFAEHILEWHSKMYPDSLKANNFEEYWKGILETSKFKYNSENPHYKQDLLKTRPGVKRRINHYNRSKGLPELTGIFNYDSNWV